MGKSPDTGVWEGIQGECPACGRRGWCNRSANGGLVMCGGEAQP
jgi:hypothetical protein